MSVARRGGSGAASAYSYWSLKQRVQYAFDSSIRGGCCFLDERVRRASCWAAAATRRRRGAAARAARNSALSSGPIISRAANSPIAAATRTTAIPIAITISYNDIRSTPPLEFSCRHAGSVGTEPLACFLKFHFQRENAKPDRHSHRDGRKLKPHGPLLSRTLNTLTCIGFPTRAKIFWRG